MPNGIRGGALDFDGQKSFVESDKDIGIRGSDPWTMSCWARLGARAVHFDNIVSMGRSFKELGVVALARAPSPTAINVNLWSDRNFTASCGVDLRDGFHHLAAVYDGSSLCLYVDGEKVDDRRLSLNLADEHVYIGGRTGGYEGQYLTGAIDEVMIYNRALVAQELKALYRFQKP